VTEVIDMVEYERLRLVNQRLARKLRNASEKIAHLEMELAEKRAEEREAPNWPA